MVKGIKGHSSRRGQTLGGKHYSIKVSRRVANNYRYIKVNRSSSRIEIDQPHKGKPGHNI